MPAGSIATCACRRGRPVRRSPELLALALLLAGCGCAQALRSAPTLDALARGAQPLASDPRAALAQAERAFSARTPEDVRRARELWRAAALADSGNTAAFVGTARASVWLTEHEPDAATRDADARLAVEAAHWCAWQTPARADCWYWLGAALGVQARERPTTALKALDAILAAFERARTLNPALEQAGPDRAMALLYLRAPGWPAGPGDPEHGLRHAQQAVRMRPGFPPNVLALAEALAANEDEGAREQYERARDLSRALAAQSDPDASEWILEAEQALARLR